jgi:molybdopterin synthase sulfur carrier subunit
MKVLFFASLRETLGTAELLLDSNADTVSALLDELAQRGELWDQSLRQNQRLQIAVNQELARRNTRIQAEDEVAFFPPVTGG